LEGHVASCIIDERLTWSRRKPNMW